MTFEEIYECYRFVIESPTTHEHRMVSKLFWFEGVMKFTLAATPSGRDRSRSTKKIDIPRVSQLTIEKGKGPQRLPEEAPLEIAIYKVTDCAGDC